MYGQDMGLFTPPKTENTYKLTTTAYLEIAQDLLASPYGNVADTFKKTGYDLNWIEKTKEIMLFMEQSAIQVVRQMPEITEGQFYQTLYQGLMTTDQLTDTQKSEFSDMTLEQLQPLLQYIIWSNPEKDETYSRTFDEFKSAMQSQEVT